MNFEWIKAKKDKLLLGLLLVITFFMFFYRIGFPSLFETDEVIYSQIAREIVRTGDWVTLHYFGHNWFIHPPLYMWLAAASSFIFGITEFNIRFWNAVFAVLLVFEVYLLGRKMFRDGVGLMGAFILATSMQYILQSRIAIFDIPLIFFMVMSVLFFVYWMEDKLSRYYYLSFLAMGFAVLMKGPVGIVLPLVVLVPYLIYTGKLGALFNWRIIPGIVLAFLAGGTWYTAEMMIHGKEFTDSVFGFYTFGRYLRPIEAHYAPWYFYFFVVLIGLLPWSPFLFYSIKYQWDMRGDDDNVLTLLWLLIVFVFFTLAQTKLPGYIMSFYPFAAISISKMLSDFLSGEDSGLEKLVVRSFKTLAVVSVLLIILAVMFKVFDAPVGYEKIFDNMNATFLIIGVEGSSPRFIFCV